MYELRPKLCRMANQKTSIATGMQNLRHFQTSYRNGKFTSKSCTRTEMKIDYFELFKEITNSHAASMKEGLRLGELVGLIKLRNIISARIEELETVKP